MLPRELQAWPPVLKGFSGNLPIFQFSNFQSFNFPISNLIYILLQRVYVFLKCFYTSPRYFASRYGLLSFESFFNAQIARLREFIKLHTQVSRGAICLFFDKSKLGRFQTYQQ
jgi:hypothetical protein